MRLSLPALTRFRTGLLNLVLLLGTSLVVQAQTIRYVRTSGTNADPATATTWATSTTNLQGAIDASGAGDQVWVAQGTYKPGGNANTNREISFAMKNGVAIYGGFAPTGTPTSLTARNPDSFTTVLSGNLGTQGKSYHVIFNSGGVAATAVLDGVVITDGNADGSGLDNKAYGGGMLNVSSSPTLTNCRFVTNSANRGGGMGNRERSNPTLINCRFVTNSATQGGGMFDGGRSNPTLTNCNFVSNTSVTRGGGMVNEDSSNPTLTNCDFQDNAASVNGGGMYNTGSSPTLTSCSFLNNGRASQNASSADEGGGVYNVNGSPTLTNCRFLNNTASFGGGGILNNGSSNPSLVNCVFLGNESSRGGGLYNRFSANVRLTNCILFGNGGNATLTSDNDGIITVTYSLLEAGTTNFTDGGNNLITAISPFVSTTDARLNGCSPAINTGLNSANTTTTDLAGNPRIVNSRIDMGAYEYQGAPTITLTAPSGSTATVGVAFSQSFTAAGGTSPYSYSVTGGSLPPGLSLATTGVLSGMATQTGSFTLAVSTRDAPGCSGVSAPYVLTVNVPPSPIRYVRAGATGSGNSWADASGDLQSQINFSGAQQVWVAQGTYKPGGNANTDRSISFSMKSGVSILGGFAATGSPGSLTARNPDSFTTVLSGDIGGIGSNEDNSYHVVYNAQGQDASALLDGVVITGGNANNVYSQDQYSGGGMYNIRCNPTITNCRFMGNSSALYGGGMSNDFRSDPTITNCSFVGNSSGGYGGGMYNGDIANPRLSNCTFISNQAASGGGVFNSLQYSPTLVMINCRFVNNSASKGGGIANSYGAITLINCSFVNNSVSGYFAIGGGIHNEYNTLSLTNCSFLNNTAEQGGGGVYNRSSSSALTNCVLFGNGGANTFGTQEGSSITVAYSLLETGTTNFTDGGNNQLTDVSPFVSATDASLNACSTAINTGNTAANSTPTDLAGNPRIVNTTIDRGAYEFQGTPTQPVAITQQPASGSSVCVGSTVTAMVSVRGASPTYQWYKDGTLVSGQTSATLTLSSVQPANAGSYSVVVTGTCPGSVTSTAFSLTVNNPATPTLLTQTGQSYPGGQSSVTVDVNSGTVNLVVGGCNGTVNWTGPSNRSGNSSPIVVSTDRVGQFVYTATCTSAQGCTSPAASATVIVQGRLTVLHRDVDNYADNNAIQPLLVLQNQGSSALPLSGLTLRYYVTVENGGTLGNLNVNYAQVGGQNVRLRYMALNPTQQGASGYVEVSFTQGAGNLSAGANSGPIQAYFAKSDYGALFEPDDYSYNPVRDQLTATQRITAYYNGADGVPVLIAGIEPGSGAQVRSVRALTESRNGPDATQINTVLEVRNEGNVAINYSDLKARYYFTADGNERLQVEIDEGNVSTQLVKLSTPVNGADTYLEIRYNQGGQLAAGASTGAIRYRISKPDGGRFNQANDYSYQEQPQDRAQNSRVVVLASNQIVWGTPPAGAPARLAYEEAGSALSVKVLGNPVQNDQVSFEVTGAEGQALQVQLVTPQGRVINQQLVPRAEAIQRHQLSVVGQAGGLLLLQVSTPTQSQTVKVIKAQ